MLTCICYMNYSLCGSWLYYIMCRVSENDEMKEGVWVHFVLSTKISIYYAL
jgi:hypothetical protein